jgi:hypothetical protein
VFPHSVQEREFFEFSILLLVYRSGNQLSRLDLHSLFGVLRIASRQNVFVLRFFFFSSPITQKMKVQLGDVSSVEGHAIS